MYGKIFQSIYDGTLAEDWRALITFQQLIVLCDADGMVDMTPQSISRRTGIPIEHIISGIEVLEKTDKYSRTQGSDGRRIELIDSHRPWGWHIINHEKYKNIRDAETIREQTRERVRRHREKKKCNVDVTESNACNAKKRYIDTETKTDTLKTIVDKIPYQRVVDCYHEVLTDLPRIKALTPKRKSYIKKICNSKSDKGEKRNTMNFWKGYFEYVKKIKFLQGDNDRGWTVNLEWITKPENFIKIIEGNYK